MKETNYSANILENPVYNHSTSYLSDKLTTLKQAVKFRLPENGVLVDVGGYFNGTLDPKKTMYEIFHDYIPTLRLPYPTIAMEVDFNFKNVNISYVIVAQERSLDNSDEIDYINVNFFERNGDAWGSIPFEFRIDAETFTVKPYLHPNSGIPESNVSMELAETIYITCSVLAYMVFSFLAALNCSNIVEHDTPAPSKLNKKRQSKNKPLFFDYKILVIDTDKKAANTSSSISSGNHAKKAFHIRRGHIRRLPNKNIWVNSCTVGDKNIGVVEKEYKVK